MTRLDADWLSSDASRAVCASLTDAGHVAYFVGGCVRNALLGRPVSDLDIATDAHPDETLALARGAGLKALPTGYDHGTVTVIAEGQPFEVTTFRRDIETDGRRAVVTFAAGVAEDAARRDFTMNALYATPAGEIVDPLGGLPDLQARRVRFIGDPEQRIAEDYLRILRFFRFTASYGDPALGIDADGLAACAAGLDGLQNVSAERIGQEMRKLLAAPDPAPACAAMAASGVLAAVLPGASADAMAVLVDLERAAGAAADPVRRLALLGGDGAATRLRLSRQEARNLDLLETLQGSAAGPAEIAYRHGAGLAQDVALLRAAATGQPVPATTATEITRGGTARFPVAARDLMPGLSGASLGAALRHLETLWIRSDFTLDRDALLQELDRDA